MRMDIMPYVESLRSDLLAAAGGAGEETRQVVERLAFAIEPAARLALMEAVSQAAAEITTEMSGGGVDVRLDGRELAFAVHEEPVVTPPASSPAPVLAPTEPEEEGGLARITLRLPESVKNKAEEAAGLAGQSLNTWLVSIVRGAVREGALHIDVDLSSVPFTGGFDPFSTKRGPGGRRMTGWL